MKFLKKLRVNNTAESSDDSPVDESLDVLDALDAADEEIPVFDEGLMSEEAIKELAASLNPPSTNTTADTDVDASSQVSASEEMIEPESDTEIDLENLLAEISTEDEEPSASETNSIPSLDEDPNRQLTPEEIASMFSSM